MEKAVGIMSIVLAGLTPIFFIMTCHATKGTQDWQLFFGWSAIELFWGIGGMYILNNGDKK